MRIRGYAQKVHLDLTPLAGPIQGTSCLRRSYDCPNLYQSIQEIVQISTKDWTPPDISLVPGVEMSGIQSARKAWAVVRTGLAAIASTK